MKINSKLHPGPPHCLQPRPLYCIPHSFHFLGIVGGCLSVCVGTVKNSEDSTRFNLLLPVSVGEQHRDPECRRKW